jgi:GGDEF domain-containing protein
MRLRRLLRAQDGVLLLGDDAFGVILENLSRAVDSYAVARKIFQKLAEPLQIEGTNLVLEVQIGLGVYPTDGDNPDVLLEKAHATLGGVEKLEA